MSEIIGAIIIYLDQTYTPREDIGLYSPEVGYSQLRWSEAPLEGFCHTMLLKGGVGAVSESFDDTNGGNSTIVGDFTFSIHGAMQLPLRMKNLSIQLSGKTVEYVEYVGTPGSYTEEVVGAFTIEDFSGNEFENRFTAKTSFSHSRNRLLGYRVSEAEFINASDDMADKTIPVTFGQSNPSGGVFFKLPRIEFKNEAMTAADVFPTNLSMRPLDLSLFPVKDPYADSAHLEIIFGSGSGVSHSMAHLVGKYVKIVEGSVGADGEIRKISTTPTEESYGDFRSDRWAVVYLAKHFSEILPGVSGGVYSTFVNLIDALLRYALDYRVCDGFPDDLPDFYIKEDGDMVRAVDVGIVPDDTLPVFDISPLVSFGEIGEMSSFKVIPVDGIEPLIAYDYDNVVINGLDRFGISDYYHVINTSLDAVAGVFTALGSGNKCEDGIVVSDPENCHDRDETNRTEFRSYLTTEYPTDHFDYYIVLKVTLPEIDDTVKFDKVYFGINAISYCENDSTDPTLDIPGQFKIAVRRYYGNADTPVNASNSISFDDMVTFKSLPEDYYIHEIGLKDKGFYYAEDSNNLFSGYKNYDLNISTKEEYDSVYELVLMFKRYGTQVGIASYIDDQINISEAAIIFEKTVSIGEELFA